MGISDLSGVFQTVQKALQNNKDEINQADELNHDHGTDMVQIFKVITEAVQSRQEASPSEQMEYAGQQLQKSAKSNTAKVYAQGLKQAAERFSGKEINTDTALDLVQTLMGGAQTEGTADSGLGGLLGNLAGQAAQGEQQAQQDSGGGLLGGLLNSLTGQDATEADDSFGLDDVLEIGLGYLQAKQSGSGDLEALTGALLKKTGMGQKQHRAASGKVVAKSLLDAIASFSK